MDADPILDLGVWSTLERWLRPSRVRSDVVIPASARLEKLNDQVFEVCKPAGSGRPSLEIVFFHGLQLERSSQPHVTTWLSRDKSDLWLNWLHDDNPDIRVLIVSYDASSKRTEKEGRTDMFVTCENLVHNLTDSAAHIGHDGCPVILVGHCLGGLVMKEVCVKANSILSLKDPGQLHDRQVENVRNFLENVKGVFFYATPHNGAILSANSSFREGLLLEDLAPLRTQTQRRNEDFRMLRVKWKWKAAGVGEGLKVSTGNFTGIVVSVPEASSRSEIDPMGYYTVTTADHFSICCPTDKKCASFTQLWKFIKQLLEEYQLSIAPQLFVPKGIVGMHGVMKQITEKLKSTKRLGIFGMGGIGKTTFVKSLYESIKGAFQYACFVDDVRRRMGNEKDFRYLQKLITERLLGKGMHEVGAGFDWQRLKTKKILIILDDVEKPFHVEMMGKEDEFSEESRIIVTSRNKRFLISKGFDLHEMELLSDRDSYKLFCSHAFREEEAPNDFQDHLQEVLKKCGNLPLALEVAGSSLFGRELAHWAEMSERIAGAHSLDGSYPDDLWSILRRSFDFLDFPEQELFLDIATCFYGMLVTDAKRAWKFMSRTSAESGWQNLVDRCLAKNLDARISMHELLRDFGKSIACPTQTSNSTMHTRVEDTQIANRLSSTERSRVQVLKLTDKFSDQFIKTEREHLDMQVLHDFHDLRALWLDEGGRCDNPPGLLTDGCIFPPRLTYVEITGAGSEAMNGICRVQGLRCLSLNWAVKELPPSLGHLLHLEYLEIFRCDIKVIPGEIGQLRSLQHLRIYGCDRLAIIPTEIGQLRSSLLHFQIAGCGSLHSLPNSIAQLEALQAFKVSGCPSLQVSFSWLCKLRALKNASKFDVHFRIDGCYDLWVTDNGREWVYAVTSPAAPRINEKEWLSLKSTSDVGIHVHLLDCGEETCFYVGGFENVPGALSDRQQLRMERLVICDILDDIDRVTTMSTDDFHELQTLEIIHCLEVAKLPPFGPQLSALRRLYVDNLPLLGTLPELQQLEGLQVLELSQLPLERLPDSVGHLRMLESLRLRDLPMLSGLPESIGHLQALTVMELIRLHNLSGLPDSIGHLQALSVMKLITLRNLSGLPESIGHLQALTIMELIDLPRLDRLPKSLGELKALQDLTISQCACLKSPWGTACNWGLRSLETLTLESDYLDDVDSDDGSQYLDTSTPATYHPNDHCWEWCADCFRFHKYPLAVESPFPSSFPKHQWEYRMVAAEILEAAVRGQFPKLKCVALTLEMRDVELFADLGRRLSPLECLKIRDSPGFMKLHESCGQLGSLKVLKIVRCRALLELPESIGQLSALEQLEIAECPALLTLPESCGELGSLTLLKVEECDALVELPEWVGQLPALQHLEIVGCKKLTKLKGSVGQVRSLGRLIISGSEYYGPLSHETLAGILHSIVVVERGSLKRLTIKGFGSNDVKDSEANDKELSALFGQLPLLEHLDLGECWGIRSLPQSVRKIRGLKCLAIERCGDLEELPESIGQLGLLKRVVIKGCLDVPNLGNSLERLGALEDLEIDRRKLEELAENLGHLGSLKRLTIESFEYDRGELPDSLGQLSVLEELVIRNHDKRLKFRLPVDEWISYQESVIRKLPDSIGQLSVLKYLEISDCEEIAQLPATVGELPRLGKIVVRHCPKLEAWRPSSQHLQHVQELELTYKDPECHDPKFVFDDEDDSFDPENLAEKPNEHHFRDEALTTVLQRQDLLKVAEEGRSLLEAAVMIERAKNI